MGSFIRGLGMGLAIGVSPGPVFVLVLTQSFRVGARGGLAVAAASVLATFPVVLVAFFFQLGLEKTFWAQKSMAAIGVLFLVYSAYDALRAPAVRLQEGLQASFSFTQGFLATILFPIPYLFWISVGIPLSYADRGAFSYSALCEYVLGFVTTLFLANAVFALLVSRFGRRLPLRAIHTLCRLTALLFLGFAVSLAHKFFWPL